MVELDFLTEIDSDLLDMYSINLKFLVFNQIRAEIGTLYEKNHFIMHKK